MLTNATNPVKNSQKAELQDSFYSVSWKIVRKLNSDFVVRAS